jgi:hypothetical protein
MWRNRTYSLGNLLDGGRLTDVCSSRCGGDDSSSGGCLDILLARCLMYNLRYRLTVVAETVLRTVLTLVLIEETTYV